MTDSVEFERNILIHVSEICLEPQLNSKQAVRLNIYCDALMAFL
jgi:hypothetical protein